MIVSADMQRRTQLHLAKHYVNKLQTANNAFRQGHENIAYGLQLFDTERSQIERWQSWLAANVQSDDYACKLYNELMQGGTHILTSRLPLNQSREWHEIGLSAARRSHNQPSELQHLIWLGNAYYVYGQYDQSLTYLQQGYDLAVKLKSVAQIAASLRISCDTYIELGNLDLAHQQIQESLKLYRQLNDDEGITSALGALGFLTVYLGNWSVGENYLQEALDLSIRAGNQVDLANILVKLAILARGQGKFPESRYYCEQALSIYTSIGDEQGKIKPLLELGITADNEGDFSLAVTYYLRGLDISQRYGRERVVSVLLLNLGFSYYLQEQYENACDCLEKAFLVLQKLGFVPAAAVTLANLVPVFIQLKQLSEATKALRDGLAMISKINTPVYKMAFLVAAVQEQMSLEAPPDRAAQWAGLVLTDTQAEHDNRVEIEKLRPHMENVFGVEHLASLLEAGSKLTLDEAFHEITQVYASS